MLRERTPKRIVLEGEPTNTRSGTTGNRSNHPTRSLSPLSQSLSLSLFFSFSSASLCLFLSPLCLFSLCRSPLNTFINTGDSTAWSGYDGVYRWYLHVKWHPCVLEVVWFVKLCCVWQFLEVSLHVCLSKIRVCTYLLYAESTEEGKNRTLYTVKDILFYGLLWTKREYLHKILKPECLLEVQ